MTSFMFLKTEIRPPAQDNDNWVFPILVEDGGVSTKRSVEMFGPDLARLFQAKIGRPMKHENGSHGELIDLIENWDVLEHGLVIALVKPD
jgi:hypothetical protein